MCVCVCCRGEVAHAEVTGRNNGAGEWQSCLGFSMEDYWGSRSVVLSASGSRDMRWCRVGG